MLIANCVAEIAMPTGATNPEVGTSVVIAPAIDVLRK